MATKWAFEEEFLHDHLKRVAGLLANHPESVKLACLRQEIEDILSFITANFTDRDDYADSKKPRDLVSNLLPIVTSLDELRAAVEAELFAAVTLTPAKPADPAA